ncbi:hypothetical protein V6N13_142094 [Hibiscus sabdariffa]
MTQKLSRKLPRMCAPHARSLQLPYTPMCDFSVSSRARGAHVSASSSDPRAPLDRLPRILVSFARAYIPRVRPFNLPSLLGCHAPDTLSAAS